METMRTTYNQPAPSLTYNDYDWRNNVIAQSETDYDIAGNVLGQHSFDLNPGDNSGITTSSTNYIRRSVYYWYDKAGRETVQADYGSGGANWAYYAKPARPGSAPASSSASYLVTKTAYNANTGRVDLSTDPMGRNSKMTFNALGQITNQWQNYINGSSADADKDVETRFTYDGLGNILTLTAVNAATGNQVTTYLYGDLYNASLETNTIYPDSTDTNASGTDQVKTTYFLNGDVKTITDQNGTLRTLSYDSQRRLSADNVTTLGSNVDGTVRKIGRTYTWNGALASVASYNASNAILDEIKYEYDSNHNLAKLYQSHSGAVNVSTTPYIQYTYAGIVNGHRLATLKYPSNKTLTYGYDTRNELTTISEGATTLATYVNSGSGNPMQTTYNQPAVSLNYTGGGMDRFGRIANHAWMKSGSALARIQHAYDYASNRTYREDLVSTTNSEFYTYDAVNQVKSLNRGTLNAGKTGVTSPNFTETWNFDKTGNWAQYVRAGVTENRTHNKANEIQTTYPFHEVRLQDLPLTSDTAVAIRCYLAAASTAASVGGVGD